MELILSEIQPDTMRSYLTTADMYDGIFFLFTRYNQLHPFNIHNFNVSNLFTSSIFSRLQKRKLKKVNTNDMLISLQILHSIDVEIVPHWITIKSQVQFSWIDF